LTLLPARPPPDGADAMISWRADSQELYYIHTDIDTGDTMFMAVELSKSPSFQPGTPKLLFRIPPHPGAMRA